MLRKPITNLFASISEPTRKEIKTCAFVVEKDLPISMADNMINFMNNLFPNNDILHVSLGEKKSTNLVRQVLGFHCAIEFSRKLKDIVCFLIIDETTDRSTTL